MSARDLTVAMGTGLQGRVVRPVLIGRLVITSDPVIAWTGPGTFAPEGSGDPALDGQIFFHFAPFFEMSDIVEDQSIGGPTTLTVSGHDLDADVLRQVVRDKRQWRGKPAYLWMGLLNEDEATVIQDPVRIKTGVMVQMKTYRSGDKAVVEVTIDRDLGNARAAPFRWQDHPRIYADDTWSTFMSLLINKPRGLEDRQLDRDRRGTDNRDPNQPPRHIR